MKKQTKTILLILAGILLLAVLSRNLFFIPSDTVIFKEAQWSGDNLIYNSPITSELSGNVMGIMGAPTYVYVGTDILSYGDIPNRDFNFYSNAIKLFYSHYLESNPQIEHMTQGGLQVCDYGLTQGDRDKLRSLGLEYRDYTSDVSSRGFYEACNYKAWFGDTGITSLKDAFNKINLFEKSYCVVKGVNLDNSPRDIYGKVSIYPYKFLAFSCDVTELYNLKDASVEFHFFQDKPIPAVTSPQNPVIQPQTPTTPPIAPPPQEELIYNNSGLYILIFVTITLISIGLLAFHFRKKRRGK